MSQITLTLDAENKFVLRTTASYLLALAGDITAEVTISETATIGDLSRTLTVSAPDAPTAQQVFNAAEQEEAAALATDGAYPESPTPASIFGGAGSAPSTAVAAPSPIAPVDTPAITSPATPSVPVPPAATPESAASTVVAPSAPPAPGVELDARGLPWDARIHSRTRSKLANGNWKTARGVEPALVAQVENELRALMAIPSPNGAGAADTATPTSTATTAVPLPAAVPVPPAVEVPAPPAPLPPAAPASAPPATPATPAAPPSTAPTASPSNPFPAFMLKVAGDLGANRITQAQVLAIANSFGVQTLPLLGTRPDLIPQVEAAINAQIAANAGGAQ